MGGENPSRFLRLRRYFFEQLEPSARRQLGLSWLNKLLVIAILLATLLGILETEESFAGRFSSQIRVLEASFGVLFLLEYLARFWVSAESSVAGDTLVARLKFVFSFAAILDLLVVIAALSPIFVTNIAIIRLIRLIRIFRLAKLGRMSAAMRSLASAVHSRRFELCLTLVLAFGLLLFGASALYLVEGQIQPEKFGSIPRALWWAVITMTTIGYGDVYPITPLGKFIAAFVALAGIGLIAMPTGILAAAFSDAMRKNDET